MALTIPVRPEPVEGFAGSSTGSGRTEGVSPQYYQLHSWLSSICGLEQLKHVEKRVNLTVLLLFSASITAIKLMRDDHYPSQPSGDGAWS